MSKGCHRERRPQNRYQASKRKKSLFRAVFFLLAKGPRSFIKSADSTTATCEQRIEMERRVVDAYHHGGSGF
jgi:hypothetical protein